MLHIMKAYYYTQLNEEVRTRFSSSRYFNLNVVLFVQDVQYLREDVHVE